MLGVLLESRGGKQRRTGGAALSVAVHMAIITAAVAGTVHGTPAPRVEKEKPTVLVITPTRRPVEHTETRAASTRSTSPVPTLVIRRIDAPPIVPKGLPPVDLSPGAGTDSIVIGGRSGPLGQSIGGGIVDAKAGDGGNAWNVNELMMHVLSPAKPRYPESLRSAGVDGRVLVEFTVDTTGRVDMASVKILSATHELFARAVRDALPAFRFRAAEVGGKKVPALAQMPFEFAVTR